MEPQIYVTDFQAQKEWGPKHLSIFFRESALKIDTKMEFSAKNLEF